MIYGAMLRSYGKGLVDIWLFNKRKDAESCVSICKSIWEQEEIRVEDYDVIPEIYSTIEEVNTRDWQEVNKDEWVSVNENGHVHPVLHNIRIVNLNDIPYVL